MQWNKLALAIVCAATAPFALAAPQYVNGLALDGSALDLSGGSDANTGRVGYFSDIHYDAKRKHWWALSDRGPGGGFLNYETRVQRFSIDFDRNTGAISGFKIQQTVILRNELGNAFNGLAPNPTNDLGVALDPEGFVVDPKNGHFLVSDEYGPSLYEFDRDGFRVRTFTTPTNLIPRNAASGTPNFSSDTDNDAGKRTNRGFEGLAISPDGSYLYAILQSALLDEGGGNGVCNRIVKFDNATGEAVAQYAYKMEGSSQGRGVSSLVALNNHQFLVLERNNRGVGVGADISTPWNKKVYKIDLDGATDVSSTSLASGCDAVKITKTGPLLDLAANVPAELGGKVPEKWEGLAIGPKLNDGSYLMLSGTDNDYSVTQNATNQQFDVYFRFSDANPFGTSIQCPLGSQTGCFWTADSTAATVPADGSYRLLPGVLVAYKVSASDIPGFVPADTKAKH